MPPPDKIARAKALLDYQEAGLTMAMEAFGRDKRDILNLNLAKSLLAKVRHYRVDFDRSPEFHAGMALMFLGKNGFGPLIDLTIRDAEALKVREAA